MLRSLPNLLLVVLVSALSLLAAELGLRTVRDEVDFLLPELVPHPTLGHAIAPGSAGHDAWGFRNERVPDRADVVAIGDSQTYGLAARARDAWPAQLARRTNLAVYNLSLGGYAPAHYAILLEDYALRLDPEVVVIAFYYGNDLFTAPSARAGRIDGRRFGALRTWLAQHSLLYQALKLQLPGLRRVVRQEELQSIALPGPGARSELTPALRLAAQDLARPENRAGLVAARDAFRRIDRICRARGLRCLFLGIPTKEAVHVELARERLEGPQLALVEEQVAAEAVVRRELQRFFDAEGLASIDALAALRAAVRDGALYPTDTDGHPNAAGYAVIAEVVARALPAN